MSPTLPAALLHPASDPHALETGGEETVFVWQPRDRMVRYQWAKIVGAGFFAAIFLGWLIIQWSAWPMRLLAATLLAATVYVTVKSVLSDAIRMRGRRLSVTPVEIRAATRDADHRVPLSRIAAAQWLNEPMDRRGLWLLDAQGRPLLHLDADFLAHEAEARAFLGWARQCVPLNFPVRWPREAGV